MWKIISDPSYVNRELAGLFPHQITARRLQNAFGLTEVERNFIFQMKYKETTPSPKQLAWLEKISQKVIGRRL